MVQINTTSNNKVNRALKDLRKTDKTTALLLRKVYTNIQDKVYTEEPTDSVELLTVYNGKEDITDLDATVLLQALSFTEVEDIKEPTAPNPIEIVDIPYSDMSVEQLTNVLFRDLGSEIQSEVTNMTTGLKVKLDMLDELKQLLRESFPDIRPEILTNRLANTLALTKENKGSSLEVSEGNLAVYQYLNSEDKVDNTNFMFMADINADKTASLDILILETAFRSYKAQVALGTLPTPDKDLVIAVMRAIKGISEVKESNKNLVANIKF